MRGWVTKCACKRCPNGANAAPTPTDSTNPSNPLGLAAAIDGQLNGLFAKPTELFLRCLAKRSRGKAVRDFKRRSPGPSVKASDDD
jgi:hypothetical protein